MYHNTWKKKTIPNEIGRMDQLIFLKMVDAQ